MHEHDKLTPAERIELDGLPRHREPGRLLEERTVRALRARGFLRSSGFQRGWWAAAAAAAVAFFATGFAMGQRTASVDIASRFMEVQQVAAMQAAQQVQRTGSAYVAALAALAQVSDTVDTAAVEQGREVARSALYAAATEFAGLAPGDPIANQIVWLLSGVEPDTEAEPTNVFWF
jgi:hypothetical protein